MVLMAFAGPSCDAQKSEGEPASGAKSGDTVVLQNGWIKASVRIDGTVSGLVVMDRLHGTELPIARPFALLLKNRGAFSIDNMRISGTAEVREIAAHADASRMAERIHGEELDLSLQTEDRSLQVAWSLILVDGSNYLRQTVNVTAAQQDVPVDRVEMIDLPLPDAHVAGIVDGSPIVAGNWFLGFEHPISKSRVTDGRVTSWIDRELPLMAGQSVSYSSVIGVARPGQMRRDFLTYIERERAHPYRTFLHYNSWYDLGYFNPYDANSAVDRLNFFGRELVEKRGVHMDSSLFDDGWDNHASLWKFNSGFPDGFTPVKAAAEKYGFEPGVWMSPWGGYSKPKQERIAFGKSAGYEIVQGGYALSGPKYYAAFRDVCLEMMRKYGVNQFKFDGTGNVDSVVPGSQFDSDFAAAIHLIGELRAAKPDLFVNLTTGTWPSPFWLMHADSIWRGGDDDNVAGVGPYRERWITYRDAATYEHVVQRGPLYPLNSLMLHGMIYAQHHKELDKDPQNDFRNEVRSYFGTGTQLQEMYITPSLLSKENWDDLAEAAKWSRANAAVLKDTHWVGGDPAWGEIYGWAAWTTEKAILVLRNPGDKQQAIKLRLQDGFELPEGAAVRYSARSPWAADAAQPAMTLDANEPHTFTLKPFEVVTLEMTPEK
ncbi:enterotoxin [Acidobacteria bacterium AB60]|nr:enterotoxin [Acidobacteria bacterium AB60]